MKFILRRRKKKKNFLKGKHQNCYSKSMRWILACVFGMVVFVFGCQAPQTEEETSMLTEVNISLDSLSFQRLYDLRDRWERDSLKIYLSDRDPSYRAFAARLFADIILPDDADTIGALISDPVVEVRRAAAYTLGQSRSKRAIPYLMKVFQQQDSLGVDPLTFKYALEAIGKCGDSTFLPLLADISTYENEDTLLLEGQVLGMFQLGQRGFTHEKATQQAVRYISDTLVPPSVRMIAANYLVVSSAGMEEFSEKINTAFESEEEPEIRMFLGQLLGQTGNGAANRILSLMKKESDPGVRVQILRGVPHLPVAARHQILRTALRDRHEWVGRTAGELLLEYGSSAYSEAYANWAFSQHSPEVYPLVLAIGNKYVRNSFFHEMIQELVFQRIEATSDPFLKKDYIAAAGYHPLTAERLLDQNQGGMDHILRTAIIEAVVHSVRDQGYISHRIRDFLTQKWKSGDVAAVALISPLIAEFPQFFPVLSKDRKQWEAVGEKLQIPKEIEADIELKKAVSILFDEEFDPHYYENKEWYSEKIDWKLYGGLSENPRAEIVTTRGVIEIEFLKKEAPASVLNFIYLSESGYYNEKQIHRVVPNFVIQGGGNRGDGYGSMDYTIRTEVSPGYFDRSGWVGMASAGMHTESQQWFITHRPALHLSGKYSRFGRLVSGREILMESKRGDIIKEIIIHR